MSQGSPGIPRVLLVSDSSLTLLQGTGARLLQHFSQFPKDNVLNFYTEVCGEEELSHSAYEFQLKCPPRLLNGLLRRLLPGVHLKVVRHLSLCFWKSLIERVLSDFQPQVVYVVPFREDGLILADAVLRSVSDTVPVVVHLFDWLPRFSEKHLWNFFRRFSRSADECWALGTALAKEASKHSRSECKVVQIFHGTNPSHFHCPRNVPPEQLKCVLVGNVWSKEPFYMLSEAWGILQARYPGLPAIQWYCSEWTLSNCWRGAALREDSRVIGKVEHGGFFTGSEFEARLAAADFAVIPFSTPETDAMPYARFSIPSRITEFGQIGLPHVAVTSSGTGLGRFYSEAEFGITENRSPELLAKKIDHLMTSFETRVEESERMRRYAEANFSLEKYQEFLRGTFNRLIKEKSEKG